MSAETERTWPVIVARTEIGHSCNCIGCCSKCGSCRTWPGHTAELCAMKQRHADELRELMGGEIQPERNEP